MKSDTLGPKGPSRQEEFFNSFLEKLRVEEEALGAEEYFRDLVRKFQNAEEYFFYIETVVETLKKKQGQTNKHLYEMETYILRKNGGLKGQKSYERFLKSAEEFLALVHYYFEIPEDDESEEEGEI